MTDDSLLRIGELGRRTGVSPEVLRAWERRYQLFAPKRSEGGFRLYSASDLARVGAMKRFLADGLSASEAAQEILRGPTVAVEAPGASPSLFEQRTATLTSALRSYDETEAHRAVDHLLMEFDAETVMRSVFLPVLREIGQLWEQGQLTVAQEHFASNLIRRRLGGLARGWEDGVGPRALLACPPDEEHDIPLMMLGIALGNRGWRVTYLGPRTPTADLVATVVDLAAAVVVVASPDPRRLAEMSDALRGVSRDVLVVIAGAGASLSLADACGGVFLASDPVSAVNEIIAAYQP
jgi:DNA-binding transcriptional MerR regulator/methylmalonyl-CoA mutase cobalamin-binding subunit